MFYRCNIMIARWNKTILRWNILFARWINPMTRWNEKTARWTIPIGRWNPKILWWTIPIDRFRKNAEKTRVQAYCMNPFIGGWGQCFPGGQQAIIKGQTNDLPFSISVCVDCVRYLLSSISSRFRPLPSSSSSLSYQKGPDRSYPHLHPSAVRWDTWNRRRREM